MHAYVLDCVSFLCLHVFMHTLYREQYFRALEMFVAITKDEILYRRCAKFCFQLVF
jgi:hypothetical protein